MVNAAGLKLMRNHNAFRARRRKSKENGNQGESFFCEEGEVKRRNYEEEILKNNSFYTKLMVPESVIERQMNWIEKKKQRFEKSKKEFNDELEKEMKPFPDLHNSLFSWEKAKKQNLLEQSKMLKMLEKHKKVLRHVPSHHPINESLDNDKNVSVNYKSKIKLNEEILHQSKTKKKQPVKLDEEIVTTTFMAMKVSERLKESPYRPISKSASTDRLLPKNETKVQAKDEIRDAADWFTEMMRNTNSAGNYNNNNNNNNNHHHSNNQNVFTPTTYSRQDYVQTPILQTSISERPLTAFRSETNTPSEDSFFLNETVTPNKRRHQVNDPRLFDSSSITRRIDTQCPFVCFLIGNRRNVENPKMEVITVIFDTREFTEYTAKLWWLQNRERVESFYK